MTKAKETKATETKLVDAEVIEQSTQKIAETTKAVQGLFGAYFQSGRKAVEGVIAFDKALFGYAREAVESYANLGRDVVKAKSINEVVDLQVAFAHNRVEQNAANTREAIDLVKTKAKEAYEPVEGVMGGYFKKGNKAA